MTLTSSWLPGRGLRIVTALAAGLGVATAAGPAVSATQKISGTFKVVCTIITDASTPAGTPIFISIYGDAYSTGTHGTATFSVSTTLMKTANKQIATFTIPYNWTLSDATAGAHLTASFSPSLASRPSFTFSNAFALPANGATTTVTIPVRL